MQNLFFQFSVAAFHFVKTGLTKHGRFYARDDKFV